jgi:hypothetical protein
MSIVVTYTSPPPVHVHLINESDGLDDHEY